MKETLKQLDATGESYKLGLKREKRSSRAKPATWSSSPSSYTENKRISKMSRAAILSVSSNLDLRSFKELSAESTRLAGLEKELIKYDEIHVNNKTKSFYHDILYFIFCSRVAYSIDS